MNIIKKDVGFKTFFKNHGLLFHCTIRADPLLGIGYVSARVISCSFPEYLNKISSTWNISQDKYN